MASGDDTVGPLRELRVWLEQAEEKLADRERHARATDDSAELREVAATRAEIATEWDALANRYDALARERDLVSLRRDKRASDRDVTARAAHSDLDPGFTNRWLSAVDRDDSSGDRADSADDRRAAAAARGRAAADRDRATTDLAAAAARAGGYADEVRHLQAALASRTVIGQAVGLVMARRGLSSDDAFAELVQLSQQRNTRLREVAAALVAEAQPRS